jgi:hypothetical protein
MKKGHGKGNNKPNQEQQMKGKRKENNLKGRKYLDYG